MTYPVTEICQYDTPNIDRMAKEGQKWTEFYSASHMLT